MQTTKFVKQPVAVSVIVEKDGSVFPKKFLWKDGHTYNNTATLLLLNCKARWSEVGRI